MKKTDEVKMLAAFRFKSRWSLDRISKAVGVHSQAVQSWFAGKKKPGNLSRKAIRDFLEREKKAVAMTGLFFTRGDMDQFVHVMSEETKKAIQEDNQRAAVILEICNLIKMPPEMIGLKQFEETGAWHIGYQVHPFLMGVGFGSCFAAGRGRTSEDFVALIQRIYDVLGIDLKLPA